MCHFLWSVLGGTGGFNKVKKGKGLVPFPFITGDRAKAWKEGSPAQRPHWDWHAAQNLEKEATGLTGRVPHRRVSMFWVALLGGLVLSTPQMLVQMEIGTLRADEQSR